MIPGPIITCWSCDGVGIRTSINSPHVRPEFWGQPCSYCCAPAVEDFGDGEIYYNDRITDTPGRIRDEWFSDRNYVVFGYLADVRNGSGFAGCDTGDPVKPIAYPRGMPTKYVGGELSDEGKEWFEHHGGDHSDSWLLLAEILDYDWDAPLVKRGIVDATEFVRMQVDEEPGQWSGGVSGPGVRHVSNEEMRRIIAAGESTEHVYTQVQWTASAREYAAQFLGRMHDLLSIAGEAPTRIVFNFDS